MVFKEAKERHYTNKGDTVTVGKKNKGRRGGVGNSAPSCTLLRGGIIRNVRVTTARASHLGETAGPPTKKEALKKTTLTQRLSRVRVVSGVSRARITRPFTFGRRLGTQLLYAYNGSKRVGTALNTYPGKPTSG